MSEWVACWRPTTMQAFARRAEDVEAQDHARRSRARGCSRSARCASSTRIPPRSRPRSRVPQRHPLALLPRVARSAAGRPEAAQRRRPRRSRRASGSPAGGAASTRTSASRTGRRCAARWPSRTSSSPRSGRTPSSIWNSYSSRREPALADQPQRLADQLLVVRRDRDVAALLEQRLEAADEARAHLVGILEGDRRRLEVDPLAEPDVVESRRRRRACGAGATAARRRRCRSRARAARGTARAWRRSSRRPPCRCGRSCRARAHRATTASRFARQSVAAELEAERGRA